MSWARYARLSSGGCPPPTMRLIELVNVSAQVTETRSRSAKIRTLADSLRNLAPDEIEIAVSFLSGQLPQGRIGLGPSAVRAARTGEAASTPTLSLPEVSAAFAAIAASTGSGSTARRVQLLAALFVKATAAEQDFLLRLLFGELRQGALAGLLSEAIARAAELPADRVRRAVMLAGSLPPVAAAVLTQGLAGLSRFHLEVFRPLQPMLALTAEDVSEALRQLGEAALELKLDGARIQVHKSDDDIRVYSRLGNEVTAAVPEIVSAVAPLPARSLVLDGEAIALRTDGGPQPFQVTMRRFGRKANTAPRTELPLTPFFFDLLHRDGDDLIDRPAAERFAALSQAAPGLTVPRRITASAEAAQEFLAEALRQGHEGIMAKGTAAPYEAGRRGASWLKIKSAHTLDLVVLAAEWGHGRRQGWLSNLHLGARDPERGGFVMLGKTFKGLTDEMLAWQTERFQQLAIATDDWTVHIRPEIVVEVAFSDVQESPHYPAGMALRFARVKRYRADKPAAEADTVERVRALFLAGRG
jgi:DNA ligase-1